MKEEVEATTTFADMGEETLLLFDDDEDDDVEMDLVKKNDDSSTSKQKLVIDGYSTSTVAGMENDKNNRGSDNGGTSSGSYPTMDGDHFDIQKSPYSAGIATTATEKSFSVADPSLQNNNNNDDDDFSPIITNDVVAADDNNDLRMGGGDDDGGDQKQSSSSSISNHAVRDIMPEAVPPPPLNPATQPIPPINGSNDNAVTGNGHSTVVDGQGMWRSWTRVFAQTDSALWDLLDNCFDAALLPSSSKSTTTNEDFHGKVYMESEPGTAIVTIRNNSYHQIKPLGEALTVYKSEKNGNISTRNDDDKNNAASRKKGTTSHATSSSSSKIKNAIGENGVGLKHGCATLSDCSVILTRNLQTVEIGIIAKSLQSSRGVYLPSFQFDISSSVPGSFEDSTKDQINKILNSYPKIKDALQSAFEASTSGSNSISTEDRLFKYVESLWNGDWKNENHVFLLVLCNISKNEQEGIIGHALIPSLASQSPGKAFLQRIKSILPQYYINLPSDGKFDFLIDSERIRFTYWQRRLVELSKFEVYIPTTTPFESLPETVWDKEGAPDDDDNDKYKLNIYCGFDFRRVYDDVMVNGRGTSTCQLYIYSCQAGRLIQKEIDARFLLGLTTSGVDYTQGLTIIVNDSDGKLPLTPTKDGIAWSEQQQGDIHRQNLYAWVGGIAQLFWAGFHKMFGGSGSKELMKRTILSYALDEDDEGDTSNSSPVGDEVDNVEKAEGDSINMNSLGVVLTENMNDAQFTQYPFLEFKRNPPKYGNSWTIRKKPNSTVHYMEGSDTLYKITRERIINVRRGGSGGINASKQQQSKESTKRKSPEITASSDPKVGPEVSADNGEPPSILAPNTSVDDAIKSNNEYSKSSTGRRRKTVNYSEMVNQYNVLEGTRSLISTTKKENGSKKKKKVSAGSAKSVEAQRDQAIAERDRLRRRVQNLEKQLAARDKRIRILEGRDGDGSDGGDDAYATATDPLLRQRFARFFTMISADDPNVTYQELFLGTVTRKIPSLNESEPPRYEVNYDDGDVFTDTVEEIQKGVELYATKSNL